MNFKKYHESKNLFDKTTITTGKWKTTSRDTTVSVGSYSDYIAVDSDTDYYVTAIVSQPSFYSGVSYDSAKTPISNIELPRNATSGVIHTPANCAYIILNISTNKANEVMLNLGSTPQPYEPYSSEVWHDIPHYIHNTSTDTLTTLPADVYADGNNATVGLVGNMSQTGTPTPTTPIQPQETGDRTGNLWDGNYENGLLNNDGTLNSPNFNYSTTTYILTEKENYTLSVVCNYDSGPRLLRICFYDENKNFISCIDSPQFRGVSFFYEFNFNAPSNSKYLRFSYIARSGVSDTNIMLNTGSTALPYENFGYKIPILNNSQATNVYLGEVETRRRIKKWVLKGDEDGWLYSSGFVYNQNITPDYLRSLAQTVLCSHFKAIPNVTAGGNVGDGECALYSSTGVQRLYFRDSNYTTSAADFKTYLQQQYANGTPVTVWYVLATPTTAIVNEPLRKIGDYADEVSGITIPTIAGANTISVDTTLQPSEVSANYKGWHPVADVHEADNGAWT